MPITPKTGSGSQKITLAPTVAQQFGFANGGGGGVVLEIVNSGSNPITGVQLQTTLDGAFTDLVSASIVPSSIAPIAPGASAGIQADISGWIGCVLSLVSTAGTSVTVRWSTGSQNSSAGEVLVNGVPVNTGGGGGGSAPYVLNFSSGDYSPTATTGKVVTLTNGTTSANVVEYPGPSSTTASVVARGVISGNTLTVAGSFQLLKNGSPVGSVYPIGAGVTGVIGPFSQSLAFASTDAIGVALTTSETATGHDLTIQLALQLS